MKTFYYAQGDNDNDVLIEQNRIDGQKIGKQNVDYEFVTMEGKAHGFEREMWDQDVSAAFIKIIEFLKIHLKS